MCVLDKICETLVPNSELIPHFEQEVLNGLVSKTRQLEAIQLSVAETSKSLKEMRAFMEPRIKQAQYRNANLDMSRGVGLGGLKLSQNFMAKQEKLMRELFTKMELERKQFEAARRKTDARFMEIFLKAGNVNFVMTHNNKLWRLYEREITLDKRVKEIEMKEVALASRQKELIAKENALEARAKNLDLWKELELIKKSQEVCCKKLDSMIPAPPVEQREKSRKRFGNTTVKSWEIGDADRNRPSKRRCHVERSSNSTEKGGTSADSDSESDSSDDSCSVEMDENQLKPRPSRVALVNDAEQILVREVSEAGACSRDKSVSKNIDYSKSLINDFEKIRMKKCFAVGQTWACYDGTKHHMPRVYVRITEVLNCIEYGFRLRTAVLLPIKYVSLWPEVEKHEGWAAWIQAGLPLGCGHLSRACNLRVRYLDQFSHQMCCKESCRPFRIYPSKGEIWALYKDWNINTWSNNREHFRYCNYEIVEVLETVDFSGSTKVTYLDRIVGFVSLFQRRSQDENDSFLIPLADLFRFSHKVPSFKMTGDQLLGVPDGSFELDPNALPADC